MKCLIIIRYVHTLNVKQKYVKCGDLLSFLTYSQQLVVFYQFLKYYILGFGMSDFSCQSKNVLMLVGVVSETFVNLQQI